jgi:hypothetical protein
VPEAEVAANYTHQEATQVTTRLSILIGWLAAGLVLPGCGTTDNQSPSDSGGPTKADGAQPTAQSSSEVRTVDGRPRVFINGTEEKNLMMTEVYHYRDNVNPYELPFGDDWVSGMKTIIDDASSLGTKVISFKPWWNEVDRAQSRPVPITASLDFSPVDQVMDYAKAKGMVVMLSPEPHKMIPGWWAKENDFPLLRLDRGTSICIPKEKDSEVSCIPKELCEAGGPCCTSETSSLYCCSPITETTSASGPGGVVAKLVGSDLYDIVECAKTNDEPYKTCDFCETDFLGWKYPFPSKGSDKLRADYGEFVKAVIDRYRGHPALFGYRFTLGAMGEDVYGDYTEMFLFKGGSPKHVADYSPFFAREFFEWLKSKYSSNQALQDAWGDSAADLSQAVIPPPGAFLKSGTAASFPDGYSKQSLSGPSDLTQKGKDFYEFREYMRDMDRQYFVSLFKERDPHHVLLYGAAWNDNVLASTRIDGSAGDPNLQGRDTGDTYDVTSVSQTVEALQRNGKVMFYGAENGTGEVGENANQLKAIERFGKAVKCFGGYFGYVSEIRQKTNGEGQTMPSWTSTGAKQAIRNIAGYSPTASCAADFRSGPYCGDGQCSSPETKDKCPEDCK